jgi:hypothetical protein
VKGTIVKKFRKIREVVLIPARLLGIEKALYPPLFLLASNRKHKKTCTRQALLGEVSLLALYDLT